VACRPQYSIQHGLVLVRACKSAAVKQCSLRAPANVPMKSLNEDNHNLQHRAAELSLTSSHQGLSSESMD